MRTWIAAATAAIVTMTAAGSFWLMSGAKASPSAAVQMNDETAFDGAERFLRHLGKGQYRQAYEMTTPELRAKLSLTEFIKEVGVFERAQMQSVVWTQTARRHQFMDFHEAKGLRWNVTEIDFKGNLVTRSGNATLQFTWINETGRWQMLLFRWSS